MTRSPRVWWSALGISALVSASVACAQMTTLPWPRLEASSRDQASVDASQARAVTTVVILPLDQSAAPATVAGQPARQAPVRLGPIVDALMLSGRISGQDEVPFGFDAPRRIDSVAVTPGQTVDEGQLLVQADSKEIAKDLAAAQSHLEASTVRVAQAQSQVQSRLRKAQDDVVKLSAGPSALDRRAADGGVASARSALGRAQADLARVAAPPSPTDLKLAEQQVVTARLTLQKAEAERDRLERRPDPADLRQAEGQFATAQSNMLRAQAELDRLLAGPDPVGVRAAQRDIDRAQSALNLARSSKTSDSLSRNQRDAAIRDAQLRLADAQDKFAQANQGPRTSDVDVARNNLQVARLAIATAQDRLDTVRRGPEQLTLDAASAAVDSAQANLDKADAAYQQLQAGASHDQLAAAQDAVANARLALDSALARQGELNRPPSSVDLQDARQLVNQLNSILDLMQSGGDVPLGDAFDPAAYDYVVLLRNVTTDRDLVKSLQADLAATRLVAPFAAVVTAVQASAGDQLEAGRPIVRVSQSTQPIVRLDLTDDDARRITVGQECTFALGEAAGSGLNCSIQAITPNSNGSGRSALAQVVWPNGATPAFGLTGDATVVLQRKNDILLAPQKAVRTVGQRRVVDVIDGTARRQVDVTVGIVNGADAEITAGLREGQVVALQP